MKSPRVSVVIPTRNSEKYLKEALDSIFGQTFTDYEMLIVDDNSSDDTLKIIADYDDPRVRVLRGPGTGLSAALNLAVREARGEFVARMDADDIAEATRLGKQVAFLDEHPDVGVCGTQFQQFMGGDAIHHHMENVRYVDMMMGCYIGHPTAMFRRGLFEKHQLFYNESMRFSEDYDLWTRAIRVAKLANIPEILLRYRRHTASASIANMEEMHALDVGVKLRMFEYLVGEISSEDAETIVGMLKGAPIDESLRVAMVAKLMESNRHPDLCSSLELVSVFHQIKRFSRPDIARLCLSGGAANDIPVFIICYNHLSYVKSSIEFFENHGFKNIHVIDNASSFPPLQEYLRASPHEVHYMGVNYKHMVLFDSVKFKEQIDHNYFVLTDPDVIPIDECPPDFLLVFLEALLAEPAKNKVGFSLKLDDLPDCYELKENVLKWEGRFYANSKESGGVTLYDAPIDTTFALYRPRKEWRTSNFFSAFRVGAPYAARHLPWYRDLSQLTEEEVYYRSVDQGSSNWNGTMSSEQLHKKYGTGKIENTIPQKVSGPDSLGRLKNLLKETFRRRRVGELRGYFLFGSSLPLLNLHTVPRQSICTTLYVFGKLPIMSKTTSGRHHVFRAFGVFPIWIKSFN